MLAVTFALLASFVAAVPAPAPAPADDGILLTRQQLGRIVWRNGGARRNLVTCGGGPYVGARNGDKLTLAEEYFRYCNPSWTASGGRITSDGNPTRCLDATLSPGNGVQPHIWDCYDVPQQKWRYHGDGTIRLDGHNLCLDVTDGDALKTVQMWQCYPGNRNQQWDL